MMSLIFFMLFLIPVFYNFWLSQWMLLLLMLILLKNFSFYYMFNYMSYIWGMDLLSYMMVLLTVWVSILMILASMKIKMDNNYKKFFLLMILFLMLALIFTFISLNLFIFYLFFEISLIPTLILIMGWGYQPERLQAGIYLLFYTLFASLPMMISIFYVYNLNYSLFFYLMDHFISSKIYFFCMNLVFLIKLPMFMFHLWLPKAHVEAPISGSMILAGIMLKLGGYGLMRLILIFKSLVLNFNFLFISISMLGGLIISFVCLVQMDLKSLVAYSSVAHMGLVMGGIFTMNLWGLMGSLVMMIAHGLCSSGLFCLVNISYERLLSRSIYLNKGLINLLPSMSLFWFLFCSCNMSAPPSLNLMGEILLINSVIGWSKFCMGFIMLISFFSAGYSLFLYSYSQHGKLYSGTYSFSMGSIREYLLLTLHWIPLNLLILKGEYLILWI
uniref:NADH-ubiquinone oxidoreductase chain 4 n=1 Tax=Brachynopus latus TaxID=1205592 RepID=A0A0S2MNN3_9COLE|nr:NADH deshydrogenase subunit 4 [Brachynopus latus]